MSVLHIDSADSSINGATGVYNLNVPFYGSYRVVDQSVSVVTRPWFSLSTLDLVVSGVTVSFDGAYLITSTNKTGVATSLQTSLNTAAVPGRTFTVVYDPVKDNVHITSIGGTVTMGWSNVLSTSSAVLGMESSADVVASAFDVTLDGLNGSEEIVGVIIRESTSTGLASSGDICSFFLKTDNNSLNSQLVNINTRTGLLNIQLRKLDGSGHNINLSWHLVLSQV